MTPEEKRLDKYYLKKFGWTLAEIDAMFAAQGNVCAACKRPPGERRMSVDHDHRYDKVEIKVEKAPATTSDAGFYYANFRLHGQFRCLLGETRKSARLRVRQFLRRQSVRGGLCLRCNKGLAMFEDSKAPLLPADRLDNLAAYLRRFAAKSLLFP